MSWQQSFEINPENMTIICAQCVKKAVVHFCSKRKGFSHYAHVECHGEHRLVAIPEIAVRRITIAMQSRNEEPRFVTTLEELFDAHELEGLGPMLAEARDRHARIQAINLADPAWSHVSADELAAELAESAKLIAAMETVLEANNSGGDADAHSKAP